MFKIWDAGKCSHKRVNDISGAGVINKICYDCDAHLYQSNTTSLKWISKQDWEGWVNSGDFFDGKGFDYWLQYGKGK